MKGRFSRLIYLYITITASCCSNVFASVTSKTAPVPKNPVKITLDDILYSTYRVTDWSGTWVADDIVQRNVGGNITHYNVTSGTSEVKLDGTPFANYTGSLSFSPNETFVLITHSVRQLWRHSYLAKYHINEFGTTNTFPVNVTSNDDEQLELQLFKWSPIGNAFAFVYNGNIYYQSQANDTTTTLPIQITTDGSGIISNGHTDWVYEEEMFGDNTALWFSPDGTKLVYIKFDDNEVPEFMYPLYGEPGDENTRYPTWIDIHYPKSGETNPTVSLHVVDLRTLNQSIVTYPGFDNDSPLLHYIATVQWTSNTEFLVVHLNRTQQIANWFSCNATDSLNVPCRNFSSFTEPNGWIDISSPVISTSGSRFLTLKINDEVNQFGLDYKHIVLVDIASGESRRINNESYSVDSILRWDENNNYIYFTATGLDENRNPVPSETQVYRILDNSTATIAIANCITCNLNTTFGEKCRQNSLSFSPSFTYALHSCRGPNVPETVMRQSPNWDVYMVLANNSNLRESLDSVEFPSTRDYVIPSSSNNSLDIRARLFLPATFDNSRKYPLFIDVYGGPGSQNIRQGFGITWRDSLVSAHDIIYGYIDGRGSGRQTGSHLFKLRNVLGTVEIEDQITATKWLIEQTGFIDPNRTAIWGWSYGGYATSMVLAKDSDLVFKCGIAVAPVTNWWYYDTIYTERFMGEPKDNEQGYANGDVTTAQHAEEIRRHQFFLVHGNADDNVHYQQTMILARALEKADVMFYQLSYPDEDHSINGVGMRRHLYHSLEKFLFRDCFAAESNQISDATAKTPFSNVVLALAAFLSVMFSCFKY